ncbi:hypothetical protein [Pseudoalteromonas sp. McH1-42]|uniref:hypothetical protein n=1 Tax=Pseudoalteromonas sp. McH1-42 TaxID=2917752 RepID=UPI001EF6EC4E|nr:hypothetical protein [Pseudoalteromonas sp. McH1-42]MCG7560854.1 hypothetical protein [Pseudoalteromonas sp. McH1-42]
MPKATHLAKVQEVTVWLGDESVNMAQVLLDLIELIQSLSSDLVSHGHKDRGWDRLSPKALVMGIRTLPNHWPTPCGQLSLASAYSLGVSLRTSYACYC